MFAGILVFGCAGIVVIPIAIWLPNSFLHQQLCTKGTTRLVDGGRYIASVPSHSLVYPVLASPSLTRFTPPLRETGVSGSLCRQILTRKSGKYSLTKSYFPSCLCPSQARARLIAVSDYHPWTLATRNPRCSREAPLSSGISRGCGFPVPVSGHFATSAGEDIRCTEIPSYQMSTPLFPLAQSLLPDSVRAVTKHFSKSLHQRPSSTPGQHINVTVRM